MLRIITNHQSPITTTIILTTTITTIILLIICTIMVIFKTRRGVWSSWRASQRHVALLRGDVLPGGTSLLHLQTGRLVEHLVLVEHVGQVIRIAQVSYECKQMKTSDKALVTSPFSIFSIAGLFPDCDVLDCRASSCQHLKKAGGEPAVPMDDGLAIFLSAVSVTNKQTSLIRNL